MRLSATYGFPGSVLDGNIIARPENGMQLTTKSLRVTLLGRSRTRLPSCGAADNAVHEGCETFLKIGQILYEQVSLISNVLEDGQISHFCIRFPEDATFKHIQANTATWPRALNLPEAQTLPPTGEFGIGNTTEYSVEAGVTDETSRDEVIASIPIKFSLAREDVAPDPRLVRFVQTRLLTSRTQDSSSCGIRLALDGPTTIAQDHSFPLVLKLRNVIDGPHSPTATVSIRSGFIQLLQHTMAWANDGCGNRWTDMHTIASRNFFSNHDASQITKEGTDLAALFHNPSISQDFPPSFKCPNIERTYGLRVCLNAVHEEHEFEFSFEIDLITVLSAELHCMAQARQQDEHWQNPLEERPFPDAVNNLRQKLGI